MPLQFTKMHGLGNDYVYICTFDQQVGDAPRLARRISDRHRGVGSDGLILIAPPTHADAQVRMIMYNADGSRAQMCGNGIRCVAKYAYDHAIARRNPLRVETDRGVLELSLTTGGDGLVREVRVDMGEPILEPGALPTTLSGDRIVRRRLDVAEFDLPVTCVSMGNPHAIFFHPDVSRVPLRHWGPLVEHHAAFPERINVHFVQVLAPHRVKMVTWERGSGPTLACGTGASAVCVAGVLTGLTASAIIAELPGGELRVEWDRGTNHVFLSGPAEEVFSGTWPD